MISLLPLLLPNPLLLVFRSIYIPQRMARTTRAVAFSKLKINLFIYISFLERRHFFLGS
jgi:hypothetical protein